MNDAGQVYGNYGMRVQKVAPSTQLAPAVPAVAVPVAPMSYTGSVPPPVRVRLEPGRVRFGNDVYSCSQFMGLPLNHALTLIYRTEYQTSGSATQASGDVLDRVRQFYNFIEMHCRQQVLGECCGDWGSTSGMSGPTAWKGGSPWQGPRFIGAGGLAATVLTEAPTLEAANATLATLAATQTSLDATNAALASEKKRAKMYMATTALAAVAGIAAYAMKKPGKKR